MSEHYLDPLSALERLPVFLERFVAAHEPVTEAHPPAMAVCALTLVGALVGERATLLRPNGRTVRTGPTTWNTLIAAPSGLGRKSTAADAARDLAREANIRWAAEGDDEDLAEKADEDGTAPVDPRQRLFNLAGGVGSSGEAVFDDVAPPNAASSALWRESGAPSTVLFLDEAGPLFAQRAKLQPHHESLRRFLLESYGGWLSGRRTKRWGHTHDGPCAVATVGTVTISELLDSLSLEAVSSGFLGRIVPVVVPATPEERLHPFWEQPERAQIEALVRWLVAAGGVPRWRLRLDEAAEAVWVSWYLGTHRRIAQELASANGNADQVEVEAVLIGRYQNLAQRMAIALTVADWEPAPYPYVPGREWRQRPPTMAPELEVSAATVRAACAAVENFASSVSAMVHDAEKRADWEQRYMDAVCHASWEAPGHELTREELGQMVRPHRFRLPGGASQAAALRQELVIQGRIEIVQHDDTGGRPREVIRALKAVPNGR